MNSISATSFQTYITCPYRWFLTYKLNLLQLPNKAFLVGKAYHRGVELLLNKKDLQIVMEEIKTMVDPEKNLEEYGLVQRMLQKYVQYPLNIEPIDTEYKFNIRIGLSIPIIGIIDVLGKDFIVEHKTTSKDYTYEDINNVQTAIYSLAFNKKFGQLPKVIYYVMNKKKVKQKGYRPQRLEIKLGTEDLKTIEDGLKRFIRKIARKQFEPNPGQHCYYCPFGPKELNNCKYI